MSDDKKSQLKQHLAESRRRLLAAIEGLSGDQWQIRVQEDGEQWTVLQMLRHLQDAQQGLLGQVQRLVAGGETVPRDFDINRWNARAQRKTAEVDMTPEQALANLQHSYESLLTFIDNVPDDAWSRVGWQPFLQKELTLEEFLMVISQHERGHAAEIAAAVGR
jgi:hypothetical protein